MSEFLEYSLLGLLSGGVMALISLSFVLIYKGTGVINLAVGEVMMLGAYFYYAGVVTFGMNPWLTFVLSLVLIALTAIVIEWTVLRPLSGQSPVAVLMATIGIASIIHGGVEAVWGGETYNPPGLLPRTPLVIGEILIPGAVLGNFAIAFALILAFLQDRRGVACDRQ
jgi:branched-chain amino acid transport system permease protein